MWVGKLRWGFNLQPSLILTLNIPRSQPENLYALAPISVGHYILNIVGCMNCPYLVIFFSLVHCVSCQTFNVYISLVPWHPDQFTKTVSLYFSSFNEPIYLHSRISFWRIELKKYMKIKYEMRLRRGDSTRDEWIRMMKILMTLQCSCS